MLVLRSGLPQQFIQVVQSFKFYTRITQVVQPEFALFSCRFYRNFYPLFLILAFDSVTLMLTVLIIFTLVAMCFLLPALLKRRLIVCTKCRCSPSLLQKSCTSSGGEEELSPRTAGHEDEDDMPAETACLSPQPSSTSSQLVAAKDKEVSMTHCHSLVCCFSVFCSKINEIPLPNSMTHTRVNDNGLRTNKCSKVQRN
jgi:hypothetical protein